MKWFSTVEGENNIEVKFDGAVVRDHPVCTRRVAGRADFPEGAQAISHPPRQRDVALVSAAVPVWLHPSARQSFGEQACRARPGRTGLNLVGGTR